YNTVCSKPISDFRARRFVTDGASFSIDTPRRFRIFAGVDIFRPATWILNRAKSKRLRMVLRLFKRLFRALRIGYHGSARDQPVSRNDSKAVNVNDVPDSCLRGLRKASWVDEQHLIATDAFIPDRRTAAGRQDGGKETSVNWEDDSQVEPFTLTDKS